MTDSQPQSSSAGPTGQSQNQNSSQKNREMYPMSNSQGMMPNMYPQGMMPNMYPQGMMPNMYPQGMMPMYPQGMMPNMYPQGMMPNMYLQGMTPNDVTPNQEIPKKAESSDIFESDETEETEVAPIYRKEYSKPFLQVPPESVLPVLEDGSIDIITLVNNVFTRAKQERASDIHIEPTETDVQVRFRIDGEFHEYYRYPTDYQQAILTRVMILSGLKIDETRLPQDGKVSTMINDISLEMRVSTFPAMYGNKLVLRILEKDAKAKTLDELGYTGKPLKIIQKNLERTYGMILMTGPTGSGKSTTLFSMLSSYDPFRFNISTLEDPVEYIINGANQAQVHPDIGFDFADGLRSLVRQDPDIIMIGEIRDKISASLGVQAALTGHLVFSTIHANSASATLQRLANMDVDPFLAASALNLIVSQRLIRRVCDKCKTPYNPPKEVIQNLHRVMSDEPLDGVQFLKGMGCDHCRNTGYKGRIAIFEVLPITPRIAQAIIKNPIASYIEAEAIKDGMKTIRHNGFDAVKKGLTTLEEVLIAVDVN